MQITSGVIIVEGHLLLSRSGLSTLHIYQDLVAGVVLLVGGITNAQRIFSGLEKLEMRHQGQDQGNKATAARQQGNNDI